MSEIEKSPKEILEEIKQGLENAESKARLDSISALSELSFGSESILKQLEKMAVKDRSKVVRVAALAALDLPVYRQIFKKNSKIAQYTREILVKEIRRWAEEGLLGENIAKILEKRYAFDSSFQVKPQDKPKVLPVSTPLSPKKIVQPKVVKDTPPKPKKPKRSLAQVLFSESSIKIALYLGAFFVVSAALIFAALVEFFRLPILIIVTLGFLTAALRTKERLAQASFTFFVLFSIFLFIDAGVLKDLLGLYGAGSYLYWMVINFLIAGVWGYGTWLYTSRFFSVAAFFSMIAGVVNFSYSFDAPLILPLFLTVLVAWGALFLSKLLIKWKDQNFAKPLFIMSQISLLIVLWTSLASLAMMSGRWSDGWWLLHGMAWLLISGAFVFSNLIWENDLFHYAAVGALMPVPWMMLNIFGDMNSPVQIFFAWLWGTVFVLANILLRDFLKSEKWKKYSLPFLLGGGVILGTGLLMALARSYDVQSITSLFFYLLGVTLTALALHIYKAHIIYWSITLLTAISAYFLFFELPFMKNIEIFMGYKLFVASLLLLLPDSLLPRKMKEIPWRAPLQALGGIMTLAFVSVPRETDLQAALLLGVMALFFFFYATRIYIYIAYIGAVFLSFSLLYASYIFSPNIWMLVLMLLATFYYGLGFGLKKKEKWSAIFRSSGLVLGSYILFLGLGNVQDAIGWYALILAILYIIETFSYKSAWMEAGIHLSLAIMAYGVFRDTAIDNPTPYILLSIGLIWLGTDMMLEYTLKITRYLREPLRISAGVIVGVNTILLTSNLYRETLPAVIGFTLYALFFLGTIFYYRNTLFLYFVTAYLSFAMLASLQYFEIARYWLPVLFALSVFYYGSGVLKLKSKWSNIFRVSGLALGSALILNGVASAEIYIGWYAILLALAFAFETYIRQSKWLEAGVHASLAIALFSILRDANIQDEFTYILLSVGLLWLALDAIFERVLKIERPLKIPVQAAGGFLVLANTVALLLNINANTLPATISFGVYALFFAGYAIYRKEARFGYIATAYLPLSMLALLEYLNEDRWLLPLIFIAMLYYGISFLSKQAKWQKMLEFSSLILGTLVALSAPFEDSGLAASIPVALTATLYVIHAFRKKNLWLGFPANAFYLMAYFMILNRFDVDQPQFFSLAAAALGMLMHYLLVRAGSKKAAFITGMLSQLVLLSTTYIQMVSEEQFIYFLVLFFQAIAVLIYGIVIRSRSLVITPIIFLVVSVLTITFGLLDGLETIFLIGCAGVFLIAFGIGALLLREKVAGLREKLDDWDA